MCCFYNGYVGKQAVAWKEYCAEYWLKDLQESNMDRCTGHCDITEILLKMALKAIQYNQSLTHNVLKRWTFLGLKNNIDWFWDNVNWL